MQPIIFTKSPVVTGARKLAAKWSIDMAQDLKVMNDWSITDEILNPTGVIIIPDGSKIPEKDQKPVGYERWKVVGGELPNGKIKILRDITKKIRRGKTVTREKFEKTYFEEAL